MKTAKFLLMGNKNVGKSTLLDTYLWKLKYGCAYHDHTIEQVRYLIDVIEIETIEELHQHLNENFSVKNIYFVCFNVNDRKSLQPARNIWILELLKYNPKIQMFLVGLQCDLREQLLTKLRNDCVSHSDGVNISRYYENESLNADIEGDPLYQNTKIGRIQEGLAFFIRGHVLHYGDRFIIDFGLENTNKDIALRIAARVSTNSLGRNTRVKRMWGEEEICTAIQFNLNSGSNFEIQVLLTVNNFFIAFNGLHIANYAHRLPFHDIRSIEIRGDIKDVHVERNIVTDYPIRPDKTPHVSRLCDRYAETANIEDLESETESDASSDEAERYLPLPYYTTFEKGFFDQGYSIGVKGHVLSNPNIFKIVLQVGQNVWPQPTIALQLEFRFTKQRNGETGEPVVMRNSFAKGKWTGEVKSELATGLRPGAYFHLVVVRGRKSFEISMNNKPVTDYPYKVNPKYVDTCFVAGDIKLVDVAIESD